MELVLIGVGFAGGYAAAIFVWPWLRVQARGAAAEGARLRARARDLEEQIRRAL